MKHEFNIRIYYEDTDMGGIVYHANYLKFTERARTEMLRDAGIEQEPLKDNEDTIFVVRRQELDFISTAHYADLLTVHTELLEMKGSSFILSQKVMRGDQVIFDSHVVIVAVSFEKMRPVKIPQSVRDILDS